MTSWSFVYEGFNPEEEDLREALCTLGNGYFATRGAAPESHADGVHYPGTYLAGGYNRLTTEIAGRMVENEDLVNLPNWLYLSFRIGDGPWFNLKDVEILAYRQELDLKKGILTRAVRFRDEKGRQTEMNRRRIVHMTNRHLAALETTLKAENWKGQMEVCSVLDGRVINAGVERYKELNGDHLEPMETRDVDAETIFLKVRTRQSWMCVAQSARTRVFAGSNPLSVEQKTTQEKGYMGQQFQVDMSEGSEVRIEKVVSLFTSRDRAISECGLESRKAVARAGSFESLLETHVLTWKQLWQRFDIDFGCSKADSERMSRILHLYIFHLLQSSSIHTIDLDVGVPSRGWHGEAYRGHIFWDELFIFPLLNLRVPEITRSLLMYRYRRLNEARVAAKKAGYRGAMYPWQSGSNGREESQTLHLNPKSGRWIPDNSRLQRHVNAAIAYNIYKYYQITRDMEFLSFYGAEMVLEIARFWASAVTYNPDLDRYEIFRVMGPDEYHDSFPGSDSPGLNNNSYTNIMAAWVLARALEILQILPEDRRRELCESLGVTEEERNLWQEVSHKMRVVFHDDSIISQFEGYDQLEEFDWEGYKKKYGDIQRLDRILEAEGDSPNHYKASKQADVLMLFYLFSSDELREIFDQLGYPFEYETIPRNINYYIRRTSHGSTLSRVVHSWVLARSDRAGSWRLFTEALKTDVADIQGGTTPEGIHLGAMAGTVDLLQRGYTGIEARGDVLWFNPCLPDQVDNLRMQIRYRGQYLVVEIWSNKLKVTACRCEEEPIQIGVRDQTYILQENETKEIDLNQ